MIYVVVFLFLMVLFFISKLKITIEFKRQDEDDYIEVSVEYLKIFKHQFEVSLIDIAHNEEEFGLKFVSNLLKKKKDKKNEGFIDFKTIIRKIKQFRKFYREYRDIIDEITVHLKSKITYEKVEILVEEGTGEPAYTGFFAGILYSIIYTFYSIFLYSPRTLEHSIKVVPNFNKQIFKININCIFNIRIGNIICVGTRILILILLHVFKSRKNISLNTNIN